MNEVKKGNSIKKIVIIGLLSLIVLLLVIILLFKNNNGKRTVMMYIVGSNLESEGGIVSADLNALDPNKVDLDSTNILIYTGGTEKWHNFIQNDENAIYLLTKDGFKKLESYEKKNMGDPNTFLSFLEYGYKNYKASKYDLIMYDHGGAIDGAIYDDFTGDNLDLGEFAKALDESPFNNKNKFETVIFRTCLNGTLEVASVFKNYSKYLVASEEITWGSPHSNVIGFLNNVTSDDNGIEFGKKFIDQYKNQMSIIDPLDTKVMTYSLIDLSKVDKVVEALNEYVSSIDLKKDYTSIAITRSNMYQYGSEVESYDMIDLYDFAEKTDQYSTRSKERLQNAISEAVLYNASNSEESYGLSIYLPYKGKSNEKAKYLDLYNRMSSFTEYSTFIGQFNSIKDGSKSFGFNLSQNETKVSNKEVSFKLTEEQEKAYASSVFMIFKKDEELQDYYEIIYSSDDVTKDGNILTTNISDNLIKLKDKSETNGKLYFIPSYRRINGTKKRHEIYGVLYDFDQLGVEAESFVMRAVISVVEENQKLKLNTVTRQSTDEKLDGTLLNIDNFEVLHFNNTRLKILDANGKVKEGTWETSSEIKLTEIKTKDIELVKSGLDNEGEYYCLFAIYDINENRYYSDLIKVDN